MGDNGADAVTYLPASLVRAAGEQSAADLPWYREVDGTLVMADLSGFTSLSERLARLGDEGAERLTATINSFFERMLKTASRYGGDTLTFGGDAILLLFDGPEHATRATVAALEMLKHVGRAAAVDAGDDKVKIGMSVGAHSDTFGLAGVGLADERAHAVVLGRGAELTALAESQAERGRLAVSPTCKDLLPAGSTFVPTGDYWLVDELGACALPRLAHDQSPISEPTLRKLSPFLPPYARAASENRGERILLTPEHRRTVIVFVNILGLNDVIEKAGVAAAVEQLQAYSAVLTRLAAKHQGFVVSSDIATKGSKLVVTFGAPVAHEYAPANAARFALDLNDELRRSGLDLSHKIGVNGGHVFAGEVGPPFRRQYTVMGDAVNLAARLMGAAEPGQALVSRALLSQVGHTLCARELPPITVKGKEKPVAVCVLEEEGQGSGQIHGGLEPGRRQGRLFGRRGELDRLARSWELARQGKGHAVLIEGDAGVGKTRLLEEALRGMSASGRVSRAACFEHLQAAPFTPWIEVLEAFLELSRGEPAGRRTEKVRAYLETHAADLVELGPLLNPLLDLSLPRSQVVGSLDAQARRQKLFELIARVLVKANGNRGHVIVLEDAHWMDDSSIALAGYLARTTPGTRVLLLLTTRPTDVRLDLEGAQATRILLAELTEPESLAMVREALGVADLPAEVGEAVYAKTRGNPLFLEEVVHSLQAPGVLERILSASSVTRAAELAALEIPDRVQGLLMSRIDRLAPDAREVLKAGSVVGRSFDETVLAGMDDGLLGSIEIDRAFSELVEAALVVRDEDRGDAAVTFRHALVQDVAYESMPFSRRQDLHGRTARFLESVQSPPDHGLLVHHYQYAGDAGKTRFHAVRASESSVAVYASLEAIDYLALALGTVRARTPRAACLRSRFEELMGDSLEMLSRSGESVDCYAHARRRWASPRVREISEEALRELSPVDDADGRDSLLCWKIAISLERGQSAYRKALRWLDLATKALPPHREDLTARVVMTKAVLLYRLGRYRRAVEIGEGGLALARQAGDASMQAFGLSTLGSAFSGLGQLERSRDCYSEANALYERVGDLRGLATSHMNLGAALSLLGEMKPALEHSELSLTLYGRLGSMNGVAFQHMNLGGMLVQMGQLDAASEHIQEVMRLRDHQGVSPQVVGYCLVSLCRVRTLSGELDEAGRALAEAREILERLGSEDILLDLGVTDAQLRLAQGDTEQAEKWCMTVLEEARLIGAEMSEVEALSVLGRVKIAQGDPEGAIPQLEACIALGERIGSRYERAQALASLAEARASCGASGQACEGPLHEAIRMFEQVDAAYDLKEAHELRERLEATVL